MSQVLYMYMYRYMLLQYYTIQEHLQNTVSLQLVKSGQYSTKAKYIVTEGKEGTSTILVHIYPEYTS